MPEVGKIRIPKRYGQSHVDKCPFCGKTAVTQSSEKVPVCLAHKDSTLPAMKCVCGEYLDLRSGKFGPYFSCMRCGNVSWSKAMEINVIHDDIKVVDKSKNETHSKPERKPREITVTSDEVDFL